MDRGEQIQFYLEKGHWPNESELSEEEKFLLTYEAKDKRHNEASSAPRVSATSLEDRFSGTDEEKLAQLVAIGQGESFGAQALRSRISIQGQARYLAEELAKLSNVEPSSPSSEKVEEPAYLQHLEELNQLVGGAKIARARELGIQ